MKNSHRSKNNVNTHGYTLIETIIIAAIISVLFIISVKGLYIAKANTDLSRTACQLEATLKNCQSLAMYTGNYYKIDFYPSLDRYRVYEEDEMIHDIKLSNINLHYTNFTSNKVYFNKKGTPSMGGTVTLKTGGNKTLYVIMTPVTGRTRISTTPPANW